MALIFFVNGNHEKAFMDAIQKAGVTQGNRTLQAVLYVLTSMPSVVNRLEEAFDFKGCYVNVDVVDRLGLSSGERVLFALAANLYNGYQMGGCLANPHETMGLIGREYRRVYLSAMEYRYAA